MRLAIATVATVWMLAVTGNGQAEPIRIVALGDSNLGAPGVARSETYPAQMERALRAKGLDVVVVNAGVNGDTIAAVKARVDSSVPAGTHVVLLSVGGNDLRGGGASGESVLAGQKEIEQRLRARGIVVVNLRSGREFQRELKDDPKFHVEASREPGKTWHLTAQGYAIIVANTMPQVLDAIALAKKTAK